MRWHEQYLGKPYDHNPHPPHSFNCGELLRHVYRQYLGYDAPLVLADTRDLRSCIKDVAHMDRYATFHTVAVPRDFDVAVMARNGPADHVGLYVGGDILHCLPKVGVALDSAFALGVMGWRHIHYLRAEGLTPCIP